MFSLMREISRPFTARCTLATYVSFILSTPHEPTCCNLGEVMNISHDSVNRFLLREDYHRTLKQVCHLEHFQVRQPLAIRNHIVAAIRGCVQVQRSRANDVIRNGYRLKRELFNEIITAFIQMFPPNLEHLNPQFQPPVNA